MTKLLAAASVLLLAVSAASARRAHRLWLAERLAALPLQNPPRSSYRRDR